MADPRIAQTIPDGLIKTDAKSVGYLQSIENAIKANSTTGTSNATSIASLNTRVTALENPSNPITTFTSAAQTITPGGTLVLPHGLSAAPSNVQGYITCTSTDGGWAVGSVICVSPQMHILVPVGAATIYAVGAQISKDATNINIIFASGFTGGSNQVFQAGHASSGSTFTADNTKWTYSVQARL